MKFVVPNFAANARLVLDSLLAGLVVCQRLGTCLDAILSDRRHGINRFFVSLNQQIIYKKKQAKWLEREGKVELLPSFVEFSFN